MEIKRAMPRTVTFRHVVCGWRKTNGMLEILFRSMLSVTSRHVSTRFVTFPLRVVVPFQGSILFCVV
jgi:hypothetical protein